MTTSTVVGVALPGLGPGSDSADPKAEGFVVHLVEDCGDGHDEALPLLGVDPGREAFPRCTGRWNRSTVLPSRCSWAGDDALFCFLAVAAVDADDRQKGRSRLL